MLVQVTDTASFEERNPNTALDQSDRRDLTFINDYQHPRLDAPEVRDSHWPGTATANRARSWVVLVVSVFSAAVLSGCFRPYAKSVLDPPTAEFPGVTSQWTRNSGGDVRVLFVHGICTHTKENWIAAIWDPALKKYFPSSTMLPMPQPDVGQVHIIDHEYQVGANKISARYLIWSDLTKGDKAKLLYDDEPSDSADGEFTWRRATLNEKLKVTLLNDCLSDAVLYAGYRGAEGGDIQISMQDAICAALDGTPSKIDGTSSKTTCTFPGAYRHGSRRIVIVTESLGSRMVFDAISALKIDADRKNDEAAVKAFEEAVAPITQIYMLANQLPILALARPALSSAATTATDATVPEESTSKATQPSAPSKTPAMVSALSVLRDARLHQNGRYPKDGQPTNLTLIAFTDPNDLLSYRLKADDAAVVGTGTKVVNVITSNDYSYFGMVEDPQTAHENYPMNQDVLKLLFGGSARSRK